MRSSQWNGNFREETERLTRELVGIPSINGTAGELDIARKIVSYIQEIKYFRENPELCFTDVIDGDPLGRMNVFAFLKGDSCTDGTTVVLHGHMDTVGVDDFGPLADYAFEPAVLAEKLKQLNIGEEILHDLESGDYLFGRGANDMKSGLAAHLVVLKRLCEISAQLKGNVLFMANPVEENQHSGVMAALKTLSRLKEEQSLNFTVAINNDYTSPLYEGDRSNYVYLGASGKLLPCFYLVGRETHVGQCFEGFDSGLLAAEIIRELDLNADLCDGGGGEYTMPPSLLKYRDLKPSYNVQTPLASFLYFNYYVNRASSGEVLDELVKYTKKAFENTISNIRKQKRAYCWTAGIQYEEPGWKVNVMTYSQLYELACEKNPGINIDERLSGLCRDTDGQDARERSLAAVRMIHGLSGISEPVAILFFAPPYCPHNALGETAGERRVEEKLRNTVENINTGGTADIKVMRYYPSLSDSSYLKIDDGAASIERLTTNFPCFDTLYPVPVREIKAMDIPAITLGCYGKDAHKRTERVYKPYTFETLPRLESQFILSMFEDV